MNRRLVGNLQPYSAGLSQLRVSRMGGAFVPRLFRSGRYPLQKCRVKLGALLVCQGVAASSKGLESGPFTAVGRGALLKNRCALKQLDFIKHGLLEYLPRTLGRVPFWQTLLSLISWEG